MPIINSDQDHTDLVKAGWITNTHGELKTILGDGVEPSYRRNYSNGLTALTWALPEEYGGRYSQLGYEACDYMCVTTSDHHLGGDIRFSIFGDDRGGDFTSGEGGEVMLKILALHSLLMNLVCDTSLRYMHLLLLAP